MREVIFKNLSSGNAKKRDVFLTEVIERDGVVAKTERRSFYYIKSVSPLEDKDNIKKIIESQECGRAPISRRRFHILKEHSDTSGKDKLICKIYGTFYAVAGNKVYTIAFLHSFKVKFVKATLAN